MHTLVVTTLRGWYYEIHFTDGKTEAPGSHVAFGEQEAASQNSNRALLMPPIGILTTTHV